MKTKIKSLKNKRLVLGKSLSKDEFEGLIKKAYQPIGVKEN